MQICGCIRDEYDKHERGAGLKINYQTRELNYQLFRYLKIGVILRELNLLAIRASTGPGTGPRGATFGAGEKVGGYSGLGAGANIHGYSGLFGF